MGSKRHISQLHDAALCAALARVLRDGDKDRVARHLGLTSALAAQTLVSHPQALFRLSERLAEGTGTMPTEAAIEAAKNLFQQSNTSKAGVRDEIGF